ncbi:hypothetical protein D3C77_571560 [compost metagenome]
MTHQVHRALRTGGANHRFEIIGQLLQAVALAPSWLLRGAEAAHVIGNDPVVAGQFANQWQPDGMVVRIAVHQ